MAQKWPKMAIFGINFNLKNYQFLQNLAFFIVLVLGRLFLGIFYIVLVSIEFLAKNDSRIGIGSKFFRNFLYCIGLGWDFWTKIF